MIYLDASVLMSLLVADAHTEKAGGWYSGLTATVIVSDLANLEVSAVLSRHLRVGRLTHGGVEGALLDFDAMRADCERLSHGAADFLLAQRVVRDFSTKLAAADALHLASAKNAGAALATLDARLAEAARRQGVEVTELG
ncbi:type II toxin-antitoxin system VapC family toxin [Roseiarcus sp.]|uniref:type II toxin-antitoxin system VapC family toxin n=1 Tax=Roseiarcus sp. TaxID=1969460 RepID=UPI003F977E90